MKNDAKDNHCWIFTRISRKMTKYRAVNFYVSDFRMVRAFENQKKEVGFNLCHNREIDGKE